MGSSNFTVAGVILLYMVLSVAVTLMNKAAFPRDTFPYPFSISCFQMIIALVWLYALTIVQRRWPSSLEVIGIHRTQSLRWDLKSILSSPGAAGAFMGMLSMGNVCLMFVQVSFYQAAKSQHILCSIILSYVWFKESQSPGVLLACLGVTVGFAINALAEVRILERRDADLAGLARGCAAGLVSSFFVALYPILVSRSMQRGLSKWQVSININAMSIAWYAPAVLYEVVAGGLPAAPALRDGGFWLFQAGVASAGFLLNIAAMLHVQHTSPLTHMVAGSLKGAVTSLIGVALLGDAMTPASHAGLAVLLASALAYSALRRAEAEAAPRAAPAPDPAQGRAAAGAGAGAGAGAESEPARKQS